MSSNLNTINKHRQTQMLELGGWNPPSSNADEVVTSHMRAWEPCHAHVPHWSWCEHAESGRPAGVAKENIVGNISMCDVFCSSHHHEMLLWTQPEPGTVSRTMIQYFCRPIRSNKFNKHITLGITHIWAEHWIGKCPSHGLGWAVLLSFSVPTPDPNIKDQWFSINTWQLVFHLSCFYEEFWGQFMGPEAVDKYRHWVILKNILSNHTW